eukprot:CAMPEP_0171102102 /NCGR_PEP_ID=MMETSP0766_2-20121228/56830_1 /TAXON_ID=439317 /ORGANISM="Gambierdiscus australes, Strain CAWD 149" /LENGTH=312 /DNA_ID=CAMNT_0011562311 /DNA_START=52 /DNA_END=988 /DNA_ORIENTATION=+
MPLLVLASAVALVLGASALYVELEKYECECLPWKDVYAFRDVDCHKSSAYEYYNELLVIRDMMPIPDAPDEVYYAINDGMDWNSGKPNPGKEGRCHNFLEKFSDGFCVNLRFEVPGVNDQWCYVSSKCSDLNGGKIVNEQVSAKMCGAADRKPAKSKEDFVALSQKYNLTYDAMYSAWTPEWMYFAKNILNTGEFAEFFSKNCDPLMTPPTVIARIKAPESRCWQPCEHRRDFSSNKDASKAKDFRMPALPAMPASPTMPMPATSVMPLAAPDSVTATLNSVRPAAPATPAAKAVSAAAAAVATSGCVAAAR